MTADKEWNVGKLLGISSGFWKSSAIQASVRLEIYTVLGDSSLSTSDITEKINGDGRGVTLLLDALVALGLLQKNAKNHYENTHFSGTFLDKSSVKYMGYIILHHHHLVDGWAQLDQAVIKGQPVETRFYGEELERESFLMGMFNLAMGNAPGLAELINLEGRKHLLDLGGGPGTYAIHFCLANPELRATVYDRSTTRDFAQRTAERFDVADRIDFQAGDFNCDPIEGTFDVAWLSHILHSNGPVECEKLIEKTVSAMEPGGLLLIQDFFLNDTMDGPEFPALFALNMLINNPNGRSYSEKEVAVMMSRSGLKDIHPLDGYRAPNDAYVLCGTVS